VSERELVRRAARGDEAAFLAVWNGHRDSVYRFAAWMTADRSAAEDIAQETFLALLRHPDRFKSEVAPLRTYLLGIARNLCRKRLRQLRPEVDFDADEAVPADSLDHILAAETEAALHSAIAALPVPQREALFLFQFEELALAEVAAIAGMEVNAVKVRLHRARQRLRRQLSWMKT
jgi:RNA polymerase sigma-70 factor (ECF subfamily)